MDATATYFETGGVLAMAWQAGPLRHLILAQGMDRGRFKMIAETVRRASLDRLPVDEGAERLARYFGAAVELMELLARACGHTHLDQFRRADLTTWKRDVAYLTGVDYGGVTPL